MPRFPSYARAAQLGLPALVITDHAGLYAAVRAWKAAQETETDAARDAGLRPVRPICPRAAIA